MKQNYIMCAVALTLVLGGCTIWNQRDWDRAAGKKFVLASFVYYNKAAERENAFNFIRDFPVKEIAALLRKKYGILVDTSDFDSFFSNEKNYRALDVSGVLFEERFAWTAGSPPLQALELEYATGIIEESTSVFRTWTVRLLSQGKIRAMITDDVDHYREVPAGLAAKLGIPE